MVARVIAGMPPPERDALLAEWHGDPRFTEPDVPSPRCVERVRDLTASLLRHSAIDATEQDPS